MVTGLDFLTILPCLNCLERLPLTEPRLLPSPEGPAALLATPTVGLQGGERHQVSLKYNLSQPIKIPVHKYVTKSREIKKQKNTKTNKNHDERGKTTKLGTLNTIFVDDFLLFSFVSGA